MTQSQWDVIRVRESDLIEDPANPNKMTKDEFAALCANVKEHGFWQPILVKIIKGGGDVGYQIVDGHHRARAAWAAGYEMIPALVWDGTEEMRRAFAVGMNKIRGELDLGEVSAIVQDLAENGWSKADMAVTGFTDDELDALLKAAQPENTEDVLAGSSPNSDEDDSPPAKPRPHVLELTFGSADDLKKAKRALRRAAGKGKELGDGLLVLLGQTD